MIRAEDAVNGTYQRDEGIGIVTLRDVVIEDHRVSWEWCLTQEIDTDKEYWSTDVCNVREPVAISLLRADDIIIEEVPA